MKHAAIDIAGQSPQVRAAVAFVREQVPAEVAARALDLATVLGRYHYVVDSVLGLLVAAIAWAIV